MSITVTMTETEWAHLIRLLNAGPAEGWYYETKRKEDEVMSARLSEKTGISYQKADELEPDHDTIAEYI